MVVAVPNLNIPLNDANEKNYGVGLNQVLTIPNSSHDRIGPKVEPVINPRKRILMLEDNVWGDKIVETLLIGPETAIRS